MGSGLSPSPLAHGNSAQALDCRKESRAPALQNKVFVYYEIRDGGPSPSSLFPFPQLHPSLLPFPAPWGLGSTQDNAQSGGCPGLADSWAELQGGSHAGELELSPWEVGWLPLSGGGQWSQDEAMSDGWNHAGRSIRQEGLS